MQSSWLHSHMKYYWSDYINCLIQGAKELELGAKSSWAIWAELQVKVPILWAELQWCGSSRQKSFSPLWPCDTLILSQQILETLVLELFRRYVCTVVVNIVARFLMTMLQRGLKLFCLELPHHCSSAHKIGTFTWRSAHIAQELLTQSSSSFALFTQPFATCLQFFKSNVNFATNFNSNLIWKIYKLL